MLQFEYDGRQHPVVSVFAFRIVEHFDVFEYVLACFVSGLVDFASGAFTLEQVEKAFGNRIVVAVPPAAHRMLEIVLPQKRGPVDACELGALIHCPTGNCEANGTLVRLANDIDEFTHTTTPVERCVTTT